MIVAFATFILLSVQRYLTLSLIDEGFVWYGAQRLLLGELPLRDFQSYDPGRYFWMTGWMYVLGDNGILAVRTANAALAGVTVALATWVVTHALSRPSVMMRLAVGAIFAVWMVPHFKVADSFATILLLFASVRVIERPEAKRYFEGGVCLGIAAMIGINHALYGVIAGLLTLAYVGGAPRSWSAFGAAAAGATLGYGPVVALQLFAPGFAAAFFDSIALLLEYRTTNLPLPWPDLLAISNGPYKWRTMGAADTLLALATYSTPLLWLALGGMLSRRKFRESLPPVIPAAFLLSLPYAHYFLSRMDSFHAAVSALPLLAIVLAWVCQLKQVVLRWTMVACLLTASLVMTSYWQPFYHLLKGDLTHVVEVGGTKLSVRPYNFEQITGVQRLTEIAGPAAFYAGPYMPGAYALNGRKSPVWEIYMIFPSSPERQKAEIARLHRSNTCYALISDSTIDGNPELGLRNTHPLFFAELERHLELSEKFKGMAGVTLRSTVMNCSRQTVPSNGSSAS